MITPQTTVVPFEFTINDTHENILHNFGVRFVICDDNHIPDTENLLEIVNIILDFNDIDGYVAFQTNSKYYITHKVMWRGEHCFIAARKTDV